MNSTPVAWQPASVLFEESAYLERVREMSMSMRGPLSPMMPRISDPPHRLHVLVASPIDWYITHTRDLLRSDSDAPHPNIIVRAITLSQTGRLLSVDRPPQRGEMLVDEESAAYPRALETHEPTIAERREDATLATELCEWADVLAIVPMDANHLAKMLQGLTDDLVLEVLRAWDTSKDVLVLPTMSIGMWNHPMTTKQLGKIRRRWKWVRMFAPLLAQREAPTRPNLAISSDGLDELCEALRKQAELKAFGQDEDPTRLRTIHAVKQETSSRAVTLPPEIWTIVFDYLGDWEMAQALGIYTNVPTPKEWQRPIGADPAVHAMKDVEWALLTGSLADVVATLDAEPVPRYLSILFFKITIKFERLDVLSHLEKNRPDLYRATFGHALLATKASAVFGKTKVLDWWRASPSFSVDDYNSDAMDGASKAGFVHVLEWWIKSGLPLRYSESALEQASARGHIDVLEWWKTQSRHQDGYHLEADTSKHASHVSPHHPSATHPVSPAPSPSPSPRPLRLKVGKSISFAAQGGQAGVIRWWDNSRIPYTHEESVAKIASANGHVNVLQLWKEVKGEKMIFDNQVLVAATKNGHRNVLEWWKQCGLRVEYKTCDIEEALEDSLGGEPGARVLVWWQTTGLLAVRTSEWMKVKVL